MYIINDIRLYSLRRHTYTKYASKKTSHKQAVQRGGARSRSVPVQAPFAIIGSPVLVLCGFLHT